MKILTKFYWSFSDYPYGEASGETYAIDEDELKRKLINQFTSWRLGWKGGGGSPTIKVLKVVEEIFHECNPGGRSKVGKSKHKVPNKELKERE